MSKDWTGNSHSTFTTLGATNHSDYDRAESDYYATDPVAAHMLCDALELSPNIWECACGAGHLAKVFSSRGYNVKATDLVDRGYGESGVDFLKQSEPFDGDIITNPPFKYVKHFIEKGLELTPNGRRLILLLRIQCLEGKGRFKIYQTNPPKYVYVSVKRLNCARNGRLDDFVKNGTVAGAACYAWYVWEKGYAGEPTLRWFNS